MDLQLKDRIAIVGGGSEGIGFGIAHRLATEGARVAIMSRREAKLSAASERLLKETGAEILAMEGDCRKAADIERVVRTTVEQFGALDMVVNNDGAPPVGPIESFDDAAWHAAVDQNLMYVVRMVRCALPHMKARGAGSFLNIMSAGTIEPRPRIALSTATWAGVLSYSKTLSIELGAQNITINTILSGLITTPRTTKTAAKTPDPAAYRARLTAEIPLGRYGEPGDIGALAALLLSPLGSYITGTAIRVDGGMMRSFR